MSEESQPVRPVQLITCPGAQSCPHLHLFDRSGMLKVLCPACRQKGLTARAEHPHWYASPESFDFGIALRLLQAGLKVARRVWGTSCLVLVDGVIWVTNRECDHSLSRAIYDGKQQDMLAEDWYEVRTSATARGGSP